jgi:hypothetical protein
MTAVTKPNDSLEVMFARSADFLKVPAVVPGNGEVTEIIRNVRKHMKEVFQSAGMSVQDSIAKSAIAMEILSNMLKVIKTAEERDLICGNMFATMTSKTKKALAALATGAVPSDGNTAVGNDEEYVLLADFSKALMIIQDRFTEFEEEALNTNGVTFVSGGPSLRGAARFPAAFDPMMGPKMVKSVMHLYPTMLFRHICTEGLVTCRGTVGRSYTKAFKEWMEHPANANTITQAVRWAKNGCEPSNPPDETLESIYQVFAAISADAQAQGYFCRHNKYPSVSFSALMHCALQSAPNRGYDSRLLAEAEKFENQGRKRSRSEEPAPEVVPPPVRRCFKCNAVGHLANNKICPMFAPPAANNGTRTAPVVAPDSPSRGRMSQEEFSTAMTRFISERNTGGGDYA